MRELLKNEPRYSSTTETRSLQWPASRLLERFGASGGVVVVLLGAELATTGRRD